MIQSILLAIDGSAAAEHATDFAASLAKQFNAKVKVLYTYPELPDFIGEPNYSQALYKLLDEAKLLVEGAAKRLRDQGVMSVETDAIEGAPADVILNVAATESPDLIVMGARGLGTWRGIILGSVSMAVTQRAESPVLIVK